MKENTHPEYQEVLIEDLSCGFKFVTRSTIQTKTTIEHEGKTYPHVKVEVSSESHPFYTGAQTHNYAATSQAEKFKQKYSNLSGILGGSKADNQSA